jgi:hypothetical protein
VAPQLERFLNTPAEASQERVGLAWQAARVLADDLEKLVAGRRSGEKVRQELFGAELTVD